MSRNNNDGYGYVRRSRSKVDLVLVLALIAITRTARAADPIFSEGGGGVPFPLEEEILEELAKGQQLQQEPKTEDKDFVGVSSAGKNQQPQQSKVAENVIPEVAPKVEPQQPPARPQEEASPSAASSDSDKRPPVPAGNAKQEYESLKSAAEAAILKMKQQNPPTKQKKEGQEEFATFVDPFSQPAQNRRLAADKPVYGGHHGHEEKRANMDAAKANDADDLGDTVFIAVTTVCSAAAVFGLMGAGVCWYRLHKQYKAAQDVEYPHYGVTGPSKERTSGNASPVAAMDAKLASSAQLYHYQHTKQQIIAMEHSTSDAKGQESEDSEGEGDEGDYSVYECPGLAPTGDIEVSNPLFENVASPHAKVDPRQQQQQQGSDEGESPRVHRGSPVRGEDP